MPLDHLYEMSQGDLVLYVSILESRLTVARNALGDIAGMCVDERPYPEIDDYAMTTRAAIDTEKDS